MKRSKKLLNRLDKDDLKKYRTKKKRLHEELNVGEKVLILAEKIIKKSAPGKFYKQTVQNVSYFNKENVFTIKKNKKKK